MIIRDNQVIYDLAEMQCSDIVCSVQVNKIIILNLAIKHAKCLELKEMYSIGKSQKRQTLDFHNFLTFLYTPMKIKYDPIMFCSGCMHFIV